MISEDEIKHKLEAKGASWNSTISRSGLAVWVDITIEGGFVFTIQITPSEGVGVTDRSRHTEELDFGGHDEVFEEFSHVLDFIEDKIRS